jgi:DNA topoisomerase-1
VNEYLRALTGDEITAKDFRTWGGTCAAAARLLRMPAPGPGIAMGKGDLKRREVEAVRAAAGALTNTVAVCRKFYVYPGIVEAYASGRLHRAFARAQASRGLSRVELAVAEVLKPPSIPGRHAQKIGGILAAHNGHATPGHPSAGHTDRAAT